MAEEYFVKVHEEGPRALYQIAGSTTDLDTNLEEYWEPKLITQARTDWDGDGKSELVFYDLQNRTILIGDELVALPEQLASGELTQLFVGSFRDDARVDLLLARTADATYVRGERVAEMTETSEYFWNYQDSHNRQWQDEFHAPRGYGYPGGQYQQQPNWQFGDTSWGWYSRPTWGPGQAPWNSGQPCFPGSAASTGGWGPQARYFGGWGGYPHAA